MESIPDGKDKQWHRCQQWGTLRERGRGKVLGRETQRSPLSGVNSLCLEEGRKQGRLGFHPKWVRKKSLAASSGVCFLFELKDLQVGFG